MILTKPEVAVNTPRGLVWRMQPEALLSFLLDLWGKYLSKTHKSFHHLTSGNAFKDFSRIQCHCLHSSAQIYLFVYCFQILTLFSHRGIMLCGTVCLHKWLEAICFSLPPSEHARWGHIRALGGSCPGLPAHHHGLHILLPALLCIWEAACGSVLPWEGGPAAEEGKPACLALVALSRQPLWRKKKRLQSKTICSFDNVRCILWTCLWNSCLLTSASSRPCSIWKNLETSKWATRTHTHTHTHTYISLLKGKNLWTY